MSYVSRNGRAGMSVGEIARGDMSRGENRNVGLPALCVQKGIDAPENDIIIYR